MAEAQIGKIDSVEKPELIYDIEYRHSLTASSYTSQRSLLSNVSGTPLLTEYYRQVLGANENPISLQPDSIETYQSYTRIKGMIIKVDGDRSPSFDDETGIMSEQGVAYVIADLAPIIFDVFIADIGDGNTGLYQVASPPRIRNISVDKVYEIDFKIIAIMNKSIEDNLNVKVVEDLVYSKDSAIRGGNAVITNNDYFDNKELLKLETSLAIFMMEHFFYEPEKTIILPQKEGRVDELIYDPYLAQFLQYTIPTRRIGMRDSIRVISTEFGSSRRGGKKSTVWDAFMQNNFSNLIQYKKDYFLHHRESLLNTRYYGGFFYSKLDYAILNQEYGAGKEAYRYSAPLTSSLDMGFATENPGVPGDSYPYYFSDKFYEGSYDNEHEKFIFDFFRDKVINKKALLEVLSKFWELPEIDQLYMGGIYLRAIKISLSTTYNYL